MTWSLAVALKAYYRLRSLYRSVHGHWCLKPHQRSQSATVGSECVKLEMFAAGELPDFFLSVPIQFLCFRIEPVGKIKHFKCVGCFTLNRHVSLGSVDREHGWSIVGAEWGMSVWEAWIERL